MTTAASFNRALGLKINREIWNGRQFDKIPTYFAAAFEGFREEIKAIVADDERVVVHFTIKGKHTGQWGPLPGTGKDVAFDEIVIMTVRDGKVVHQAGVIDNVTGLRQVGAMPGARP